MSYWVEGSKVWGPKKGTPPQVLVADCTATEEPEKTAVFLQGLLNDQHNRILGYQNEGQLPTPFPASIAH